MMINGQALLARGGEMAGDDMNEEADRRARIEGALRRFEASARKPQRYKKWNKQRGGANHAKIQEVDGT